jgi:hypothetical protein
MLELRVAAVNHQIANQRTYPLEIDQGKVVATRFSKYFIKFLVSVDEDNIYKQTSRTKR